jgi:hypothetical protein
MRDSSAKASPRTRGIEGTEKNQTEGTEKNKQEATEKLEQEGTEGFLGLGVD